MNEITDHVQPLSNKCCDPAIWNSTEHWEGDEKRNKCLGCEKEFDFAFRRHHCRSCGKIFCDACSSYSLPYESVSYRLCTHCYAHFSTLTHEITIKVESARYLPSDGFLTSIHPYVKCRIGCQTALTDVPNGEHDPTSPKWNQVVKINFHEDSEAVLHLSVFSRNILSADEHLGQLSLTVAELAKKKKVKS